MKKLTIEEMPVLEEYVRRIPKNLFKDYCIIYINHLISDSLMVARAFAALGAFVATVPVPYGSTSSQVRKKLLKEFSILGMSELPKLKKTESFTGLVQGVAVKLIRKMQKNPKLKSRKLIVVEDGGYIFPYLHDNKSLEDILSWTIGAVEHTARGMWNYQYYEQDAEPKTPRQLTKPAITVASSLLKEIHEPPFVAEAIIDELRFSLRKIHQFIKYKKAIVLGAGRIGKGLASCLENQSVDVYLYDTSKEKIDIAKKQSYKTIYKLNKSSLNNTKLIIGACGRESFTVSDLLRFFTANSGAHNSQHVLMLASASSKQLEFQSLLKVLNKHAKSDDLAEFIVTKQEIEEVGTIYELNGKKDKIKQKVILIANGYPTIFFPSSTHGAPNRVMDPIMTELFLAACYLAVNHKDVPLDVHEIKKLKNLKLSSIKKGPWNDLLREETILERWCHYNDINFNRYVKERKSFTAQ